MKKLKVVSIILLIIIAILAVLVWWQFGNIKSVYYWFKYDNQNVSELVDKQKNEVDKYIRDKSNLSVRQSTEAEQKLHQEEIINDDEFVDVLTGKTNVKEMFGQNIDLDDSKNFVDENGKPISKEELESSKKENEEDKKEKDNTQRASECVARMYVLKSNFESRLAALANEAKLDYISVPNSERSARKSEVVKKVYSRAVSLESECDAQVELVLKELDSILRKSGEDRSIVDKIRKSYGEEKSLKKAYYLNLLNKY